MTAHTFKNILTASASLLVPLGVHATQSQELRAGPIKLFLSDGELRYLTMGDREIVRRIYVTVRDTTWDTQPPEITHLTVKQESDSFLVQLEAVCRGKGIDYAWKGEITGTAEGRITFKVSGTTNSASRANRFGMCVLFGSELKGRKFETMDSGVAASGMFPLLLEKIIIADRFQTLSYPFNDDLGICTTVNGANFGMEDQRLFGDSSYKAFSEMPYSYPDIKAGVNGNESVTIELKAASVPRLLHAKDGPIVIRLVENIPTGKFPRIAPVELSDSSRRFFLEAYQHRATQTGSGLFRWPLNVAVNLFDDDSWFENLETVIDQAKTVQSFSPDSRLLVAASFNPPYRRAVPDQRTHSQFAAAWVVAAMANLTKAGVDEVGFDLTDERPSTVLRALERLSGRTVIQSQNSDRGVRPRVEVCAVRDGKTTEVFLTNTTNQSQSVIVHGLPSRGKATFSHLSESSTANVFEPAPSPTPAGDGFQMQLSLYEVYRLSFVELP